MRDIRFRMWDTKSNKFFTNQPEVFACLIQQISGMFDHERNGSVFEQFTGLRDKHGVEIYEGDVCRADSDAIGDIVWHNGAWCWTDGICHWFVVFAAHDSQPQEKPISQCKDMTVIGNVHQEDAWKP